MQRRVVRIIFVHERLVLLAPDRPDDLLVDAMLNLNRGAIARCRGKVLE